MWRSAGCGVSPAEHAARLRAAGAHEAADCIEHLLGVIERNRSGFEALKTQAQHLRDRAIKAEAALAELRLQTRRDPTAEALDALLGRRR